MSHSLEWFSHVCQRLAWISEPSDESFVPLRKCISYWKVSHSMAIPGKRWQIELHFLLLSVGPCVLVRGWLPKDRPITVCRFVPGPDQAEWDTCGNCNYSRVADNLPHSGECIRQRQGRCLRVIFCFFLEGPPRGANSVRIGCQLICLTPTHGEWQLDQQMVPARWGPSLVLEGFDLLLHNVLWELISWILL